MSRTEIHLTPDQILRLQGAALGILEDGPWDADKTRMAKMVARTVSDALRDVPYNADIKVNVKGEK